MIEADVRTPFDLARSRSPAQHPKTEKAELMSKAKTRQDDAATNPVPRPLASNIVTGVRFDRPPSLPADLAWV